MAFYLLHSFIFHLPVYLTLEILEIKWLNISANCLYLSKWAFYKFFFIYLFINLI
jgi:hypothetical protein